MPLRRHSSRSPHRQTTLVVDRHYDFIDPKRLGDLQQRRRFGHRRFAQRQITLHHPGQAVFHHPAMRNAAHMLQMVSAGTIQIFRGGIRLDALAQDQHPLLQEGAAIIKMEKEAHHQQHHHEDGDGQRHDAHEPAERQALGDLGDGEETDRQDEDQLPGKSEALGEGAEAAKRIGVVNSHRRTQQHEDPSQDRSPFEIERNQTVEIADGAMPLDAHKAQGSEEQAPVKPSQHHRRCRNMMPKNSHRTPRPRAFCFQGLRVNNP